jgi:hypothetical protein
MKNGIIEEAFSSITNMNYFNLGLETTDKSKYLDNKAYSDLLWNKINTHIQLNDEVFCTLEGSTTIGKEVI